jgi:hypothetical protein
LAPTSPEEGKKSMDAWMVYFGKLGDKIVDMGAPIGQRKALGGAPSSINGYTIISAATFDEAVAMADGHPHLAAGGAVEIYKLAAPGM